MPETGMLTSFELRNSSRASREPRVEAFRGRGGQMKQGQRKKGSVNQ